MVESSLSRKNKKNMDMDYSEMLCSTISLNLFKISAAPPKQHQHTPKHHNRKPSQERRNNLRLNKSSLSLIGIALWRIQRKKMGHDPLPGKRGGVRSPDGVSRGAEMERDQEGAGDLTFVRCTRTQYP